MSKRTCDNCGNGPSLICEKSEFGRQALCWIPRRIKKAGRAKVRVNPVTFPEALIALMKQYKVKEICGGLITPYKKMKIRGCRFSFIRRCAGKK